MTVERSRQRMSWYTALWNKVKWVLLVVLAVLALVFTAGHWESIALRFGLKKLPEPPDPTPIPSPEHEEVKDYIKQNKNKVEASNEIVDNMDDDELIADIDNSDSRQDLQSP
jgi:hypothetical protein